ncbi:neuraminidase-like domain-containing protein [Yersinia mollaretii]|uniref:Tc toxin subunit A-related protein n=1 Tax=Yersinia mollaretii TaxID=33060 RepID=UPI0005E90B77|nr:neuraminidase-like domain-containing protein [Yersinia mollaretii]MDA5527468.1 neuraminidase-like domain-containing protein [Yersinia mollaretii]MDR7874245.1 neuraminidase-like domain-containing protein [Yersinia mollaretii]PHZ32665.1 toxin [Yersinia mollaretii]WQC74913.1 neuraminidase-like domain-containing protein [Yersinia mollaretii]CQJ19838.1 putative toxin subunit [Yersinia mollaretii]
MSNATVLKKINESRRDALVNYALANKSLGQKDIKNPDELYQYLLLDTKIGAEVKTSKVAEAISSLQLYIERSIEGAEPDAAADKVAKHFSTDKFLHNWSTYNKRYARWAGKEKLKYYAADYIDPTLRYNKTELFTAFEQSINQGKLTENAITKALQKYLIQYDELCHLETIAHVEASEKNTHYFIGRSQHTPYQYFWRSCRQATQVTEGYIWSEWKKVNVNIDPLKQSFIRLFWDNNRLYIYWPSTEEITKSGGGKETHNYHNFSYKNDDDNWVILHKKEAVKYDQSNMHKITNLNEESINIINIKNPDDMTATGNIYISHQSMSGNFTVEILKPLTMVDYFLVKTDIEEVVIVYEDGSDETIKNTAKSASVTTTKIPAFIYYISLLNHKDNFTKTSNDIITHNPVNLTSPNSLPLLGKLQEGVNALLDYKVQENQVGLPAFSESYGIYLWELFFHIPLLASARFLTEQRFDDAERWLKFLFNSAGYRNGSGQLQQDGGNTRYWNILPLQKDQDWDSSTALATTDPDVIAMNDPMQYKLAVFMRTLDVLITRGDQAYRQLERDTLVDAKMYYIQASQLLGSRPAIPVSHDWKNLSLKETAAAVEGHFLPPYNEVLLAYWDKLDIRLYNLRHNLSLEGQPLHLPLFATPIDPQELQRQHSAGAGINTSLNNIAASTSLYRFPLLLERAKSAVGSVMQFGNALQMALEKQDNEALSLLLQQQQQQVLKQTRDIQNANIAILQSSRAATEVMKKGAEARRDYYKQQVNNGISSNEQKALEMRVAAQTLGLTAIVPLTVGGALDTAPNIFGLADGGSHWGAISQSITWGIQITAGGLEQGAGIQEIKGNYARRAEEWQLQKTLAEQEVAQLQEQLTGLALQISMAEKQRNLAEMEQSHALAIYQMQTTRFSGKELYNWMVGRLSGLYYQLFDAAQPLCLMAKSALERDIDASKTQQLFTNAGWNDLYQGLLAGEDLMLNLHKMENIWLIEDQRALEVERTISLAEIYQKSANFNLSEKVADYASGTVTEEVADGSGVSIKDDILSASIKISELALMDDYPAHMHLGEKRRIKQISVTLPALLGPYQDVQATLSYDGSSSGLANGCTAMAISRGMNDSGQFQLDFNDGKYLPFEGIDISDQGALVLRFPNATAKQQGLLQSLSDIILHIRYTIRA